MEPGTVVTTDTEGDGASAADPIETTFTCGDAVGTVFISELQSSEPIPGFQLLDLSVSLDAPPPSSSLSPHILEFSLHTSFAAQALEVFKDGVPTPVCC